MCLPMDVPQIILYTLVLNSGCLCNEALLSSLYAPRPDSFKNPLWRLCKAKDPVECELIRSANKTERGVH